MRTAPIVCPEESPQCARRRIPLPRWGLARRLRRELGLAVPRGAHTFLSVAKEKCAKESQRHGDSGKKASIAHFDGGPFSLRCLSPLCSPTVGGGQTYPLRGGTLRRGLGIFAAQMNRLIFFFPQSAWGRLTPCRVEYFNVACIFLQRKRPAWI